jgi:hypothetical protein
VDAAGAILSHLPYGALDDAGVHSLLIDAKLIRTSLISRHIDSRTYVGHPLRPVGGELEARPNID